MGLPWWAGRRQGEGKEGRHEGFLSAHALVVALKNSLDGGRRNVCNAGVLRRRAHQRAETALGGRRHHLVHVEDVATLSQGDICWVVERRRRLRRRRSVVKGSLGVEPARVS